MLKNWSLAVFTFLCAALSAMPLAQAQTGKPETAKVRLAVGGQPALYYLPLTVADKLGYFREQGLEVEISDFQGGAKSLQALVGGSADVVAGAYDHTIQMQAKNQPITAVVELGRFPGFVLAALTEKAAGYKSPRDLKGMKIGVTAPGSSTHFMVLYMMAQNGLKAEDASFVGVGAASTAVVAVKRGEIDAIVSVDPVINLLESQGLIKVLADTRTLEGTQQVYGGTMPAAVLYMFPSFIEKNPNTVQALVNAFVRTLKWIQTHSAEEIAKVMPAEYALGDMQLYVKSIKSSIPTYSLDGRLTREGAETTLKVLKRFDPNVQNATIDVSKTYTNAFVEKALATQ